MLCYDSDRPGLIPPEAAAILIYGDGDTKWTPAEIARFPHARRRTISVLNNPKIAAVLDVELGDAAPADAPGFLAYRREHYGDDGAIYCNRATLPKVQAELALLHGDYRIWLATLDGTKPTGITGGGRLVAVQFERDPEDRYDVSVIYDTAWLRQPPA